MIRPFGFAFCILMLALTGCNQDDPNANCPPESDVLDRFTTDKEYLLTVNGKAYVREAGGCTFLLDYFPATFADNYRAADGEIFTRAGELPIKTVRSLTEDFEKATRYTDLFITSPATLNRNWTDVVLQSPLSPTVPEYVALRKCLIESTCDFKDNRIDLIQNIGGRPGNSLRFTAVAPSAQMVTSKASIENTLCHADADDEVVIEADFFIEKGFPFSLFDFENKWFNESPGPRLVFRNSNQLAVELKYGTKPDYRQPPGSEQAFPTGRWVRVKVSYVLKSDFTGSIRVWQDNMLIIDQTGKTLPTSNSIQTSLEMGITATSTSTVLYMDNVSFTVNRR